MKRFVISVGSIDEAEEKAVSAALKERGYGWWHWLPTTWLVTTMNSTTSSSELRDLVKEATNNARVFVVEVTEPRTWSGYGPKKGEKNMFAWIKKNWDGSSNGH